MTTMSTTASFASSDRSTSVYSGDDNSTVLTDLLSDASIPWEDEDILTLTVRSSRLIELAQHVENLLRKLPANSVHGVAPLLINDFGNKPPNTPRVVRLIVDSDANPPIVQFLRQLFQYVQITGIRLNYEMPPMTAAPVHILRLADEIPRIATLKNMALCTNGCTTFLYRALAAPACHLERLCISAHYENHTPCFRELAQALRLGVSLKSVRLYNILEVSDSNFVAILDALKACPNLNRFVVEDLLLSFSLDVMASFVKDHTKLEILEVLLSAGTQHEAQEMMQTQSIQLLTKAVLASKTLKRVILPFWPVHSPKAKELVEHVTRSPIEYLDLSTVKVERQESSDMLNVTVKNLDQDFEDLGIGEDQLEEWVSLMLEAAAEISHKVCSLSVVRCCANNLAELLGKVFVSGTSGNGCAITNFSLDHSVPLPLESIQQFRKGWRDYSKLTHLSLALNLPGDMKVATLIPKSQLEEVTLTLKSASGNGEALAPIAGLLQQQVTLARLKLDFQNGFGEPTPEEFAPFGQALQIHPALTTVVLCGTSPVQIERGEGGTFVIGKRKSTFLARLFEALSHQGMSLQTVDLSEWGDSVEGWVQAIPTWVSVKNLKLPEGDVIRESLENGLLLPALKQNMRICQMDAQDDFALEMHQDLAKGLVHNQMINRSRSMADHIHHLSTQLLWPTMLARLRLGKGAEATPIFLLLRAGISSFASVVSKPTMKRNRQESHGCEVNGND